jgi:hypothetical protein
MSVDFFFRPTKGIRCARLSSAGCAPDDPSTWECATAGLRPDRTPIVTSEERSFFYRDGVSPFLRGLPHFRGVPLCPSTINIPVPLCDETFVGHPGERAVCLLEDFSCAHLASSCVYDSSARKSPNCLPWMSAGSWKNMYGTTSRRRPSPRPFQLPSTEWWRYRLSIVGNTSRKNGFGAPSDESLPLRGS